MRFFLPFLALVALVFSLMGTSIPESSCTLRSPLGFLNKFKDFSNPSISRESLYVKRTASSSPIPTALFKNTTIDHFSAFNSGEFSQMYFINKGFCNPSDCSQAPFVSFIMPQEVGYTSDPTLVDGAAAQFGAISVTVEHRYYGVSFPFPMGPYDTPNMEFFTVEQAMEDFVEFQDFIRKTYSIPESIPWILFGCSYSGALSAWTKAYYPHLFLGSIAGSSVIEARTDFSQYTSYMGTQIPSDCRNYIAQASQAIVEAVQTPAGRQQLWSMFSMCGPQPDALQFANNQFLFAAYVFNQISQIVQYGQLPNIQQMCQQIQTNATSPLTGFANYMVQNALSPGQCLYIDYWNVVGHLSLVQPDDVAFAWQQCTQLGYFQTTEGPDNILPPWFNTTGYLQFCNDIFNTPDVMTPLIFANDSSYSSLPKTRAFNEAHGSHNIQLTHTLFVNGGIDSYHFLSNWEESQMVGLSGQPDSLNGVLFYPTHSHCSYGQNYTGLSYGYITKWLKANAIERARDSQAASHFSGSPMRNLIKKLSAM